ncbi:MAG: hypothetical protein N2316_13835 [Spirochaetes bacterium]|nr:hypothetical protein [Spirochaetota bacterium]
MKIVFRIIFFIILFSMLSISFAFRESNIRYFIDPKTEKLLQNLADAIEYNIGYHRRCDVPYMYKLSATGKILSSNEKEFSKIINMSSKDDLEKLFEAVIKIQCAIEHKAEFYKKTRNWRNYTFCKNYLLPATVEFNDLIKKALIGKDLSIVEREIQLRLNAKNWVKWYYRYSEEPIDIFP